MKPHIHAENSVKNFGGKPEDYIKIHQWFDESKSLIGDNRHRALRHHSFGIFEAEKVFGITITNSDGKLISVRDIGEQHVFEDLGFIPSVSDYFSLIPTDIDWISGSKRKKEVQAIKKLPTHVPPRLYDGSRIPKPRPFLPEPEIFPQFDDSRLPGTLID